MCHPRDNELCQPAAASATFLQPLSLLFNEEADPIVSGQVSAALTFLYFPIGWRIVLRGTSISNIFFIIFADF